MLFVGFLFEVKAWYDFLMPQLLRFLYSKGGPVIMMQIENEYGLVKHSNEKYLTFLVDVIGKNYIQC